MTFSICIVCIYMNLNNKLFYQQLNKNNLGKFPFLLRLTWFYKLRAKIDFYIIKHSVESLFVTAWLEWRAVQIITESS